MTKYAVRYTETYADTYIVEANTFDEAVEKLDHELREGMLEGPRFCSDSEYSEAENVDPYDHPTDVE